MRMNLMGRSVLQRKTVLVLIVAFVAVCQLSSAIALQAATVSLTWTFNYAVDVPCTTSVTKNCVTGFEYGTTPDGGTTLVKIATVANPSTSSSGSSVSVAVSFSQGAPFGPVVYYARTIGLDGNGNTLYSSPALATAVTIAPSAPSGLTATVK